MYNTFSGLWSCSKLGHEKSPYDVYPTSMQKSIVEMPRPTAVVKRKREGSIDSPTSHHAQSPKKLRGPDGAVRPMSEFLQPVERPVLVPKSIRTGLQANIVQGNCALESSRPTEQVLSGFTDKLACSPSPACADVKNETSHEAQVHNFTTSSLSLPSIVSSASPSPTMFNVNNNLNANTMQANALTPELRRRKLQEVIEAEYSMAVLNKHGELRVIEQELAKCQTALEQIRRCNIIPFPGTQGASVDVSNHSGPSINSSPDHTSPAHPAPWGVTDGPYSRHYSHWLIRDGKFDSYPNTPVYSGFATPNVSAAGRPIRQNTGKSFALPSVSGSAPRVSRVSQNTSMSVPVPQENTSSAPTDPLLIFRQSDQKYVRVWCPLCQHDNFSNVQGFINHYRIAHDFKFKTHQHAADACGRIVDPPEDGVFPSVQKQQKKSSIRCSTTSLPATPIDGSLVHPAINDPTIARRVEPLVSKVPQQVLEEVTVPADFVPHPTVPRLSKLSSSFHGAPPEEFAKMIQEATTRVDMTAIDREFPPEEEDEQPKQPSTKKVKSQSKNASSAHSSLNPLGSRLPTHLPQGFSPSPAGRPVSSKGLRLAPSVPHQQPHMALTHHMPESPMEMDMSPNTMESNPGLMSDHDDEDDEFDDANSEAVHGEHGVVKDSEDVMMVDSEAEHDDVARLDGSSTNCHKG
ncbi:hypothetical protein K402DRAFT_403210 [Aulographum hederae CBS 113979]|uniref:Uncharacterized protein n=1 Tax=Aulographum hederae CBS 113979 TaxID=1176131 RepID=A0A6G1H469_9PEZI|nr:hypothetical protein K402DRAFT_403210 [Aulographum hederae CBS 113979]